MHKVCQAALIALLLLIWLPPSLAVTKQTYSQVRLAERAMAPISATPAVKARMDQAISLFRSNSTGEAFKAVKEVYNYYFDRMTDKSVLYRSFTTQQEYHYYLKNEHPKKKVVWVDEGLADALIYWAWCSWAFDPGDILYLYEAIDCIEDAVYFAPYNAKALCAAGYLYAEIEDPQSLYFYSRAVVMADRFDSEKPYKAQALRGKGYALTGLGSLEAARTAYEQSLEIDAGNQTARREIDYINNRLQRGAGGN